MRDRGVRKTELARRLGVHLPQVDRLLDLRHGSRLDQVEDALRAVGKELVLTVQDAA
jgi:antitoxin HicB